MPAPLVALFASLIAFASLILWVLAERRCRALKKGLKLALEGRSRHDEGQAASLSTSDVLMLRDVRRLATQSAAMQPEAYRSRLYERLLDQLRQAVIIVNPDFRIALANRAVSRLFPNYNQQPEQSLTTALRQPAIDTLVREAAEMQTWRSVQIHITELEPSAAQSEQVFAAEAAPLPTAQGQGVWLIIEDITERVMTERIRKDFVANASHELRTPLTLILGYIETLSDGLFTRPEVAQRSLSVMEKHGKRLLRLVEDMLTLSRFESSDEMLLKNETFVVEDCVRDVLSHLTLLIENLRPIIKLNFPDAEVGVLHGDRFYWDQIFSNLIENAIKENPQGGLLLTVSGEWSATECVLKVSDNGVGIPTRDAPFVFKRFYRAAKHRGQEIKGTGLGLSIVKRAVEAHHGSVELSSVPGLETVFTMRIPISGPTSVV